MALQPPPLRKAAPGGRGVGMAQDPKLAVSNSSSELRQSIQTDSKHSLPKAWTPTDPYLDWAQSTPR